MGTSVNGPIEQAQARVRQAQSHLEACKANRDSAKKNGNYKNSSKSYHIDGKNVNSYDWNVIIAQKELKKAKELLAEAKKKK